MRLKRNALLTCSMIMMGLAALGMGGCPMATVPADTGGTTGGNTGGGTTGGTTLTGVVADGQAKYNSVCAACHLLGTFDTTGFAGDLKTHSTEIVNDLGTLNAAMTGIMVTDQEIADLQAFIATQ